MAKLYVVGFGPGGYEHMTVKAVRAIEGADLIIGYTAYVEMLKAAFPDKIYLSTPMTKEIDRCRLAVEKTMAGLNVALVSSGDSGIYGMAGIVLQVADQIQAPVEIEIVPGVTAASAAAAVLGAPLMHDTALISLSDLMTPLDLIMKRVSCAAQAAALVMEHRSAQTPVGIVRHAGRDGQQTVITELGKLAEADIDMFSIVIIGNSRTYVKDGKMITPRGYQL